MHTTEFKTVIKTSYINIPEFEKFKDKEVKVTIIDLNNKIEKSLKADDFITKAIKNPKHINVNNNFLSREEANER